MHLTELEFLIYDRSDLKPCCLLESDHIHTSSVGLAYQKGLETNVFFFVTKKNKLMLFFLIADAKKARETGA